MTEVTQYDASAVETGKIAALAASSQRRMKQWVRRYPGLFAHPAMDDSLYHSLALAAACSGPWHSVEELEMANQACLWGFGLDLIVDHTLHDSDELHAIIGRLKDVLAGGPAPEDDELALFLADIRDRLKGCHSLWVQECHEMLDGMVQEWQWKHTNALPSLEDYLGNSRNIGFAFVTACHWAANGGRGDAHALQEAMRAVQQVIRLLNDIGSLERDRQWGDLNALLLGVSRQEVERRLADLTQEADPLLEKAPPEYAEYMRRQMSFCAGYYGTGDFWNWQAA